MLRTLLTALALVVALVASAVVVAAVTNGFSGQAEQSGASDAAEPAPVALADFDPAFIVSDPVLYDGDALSAGEVQDFLESKAPVCAAGATCLVDFAQDTESRPADKTCSRYAGAEHETAAEIIAKVGQACGISQKALIVLLEKEQSLVDDPAPTERSYAAATGYACPDTADCDVNYAGFYNQVYWAAWQLKRYANPPGTDDFFSWIPVGAPHDIQFNPDLACGASPVTVATQATAALYYYTPYQPNQAVLAGNNADPCGAFGNLNFWRFYNEWFGSPTLGAPPTGSLDSVTASRGAVVASGWALDPTSEVVPSTVRIIVTSPKGETTSRDVVAGRPSSVRETGFPLGETRHGFVARITIPESGLYRVCATALPLPINQASPSALDCRWVIGLRSP